MPLINIHRIFLLRVNNNKGVDAMREKRNKISRFVGTNCFCDSRFVDSRDYIY